MVSGDVAIPVAVSLSVQSKNQKGMMQSESGRAVAIAGRNPTSWSFSLAGLGKVAYAKYADALRMIWLAAQLLDVALQQLQPSLGIGRLRRRAPRRLASSRHQRRSISVVQPIVPASDVSAAHS